MTWIACTWNKGRCHGFAIQFLRTLSLRPWKNIWRLQTVSSLIEWHHLCQRNTFFYLSRPSNLRKQVLFFWRQPQRPTEIVPNPHRWGCELMDSKLLKRCLWDLSFLWCPMGELMMLHIKQDRPARTQRKIGAAQKSMYIQKWETSSLNLFIAFGPKMGTVPSLFLHKGNSFDPAVSVSAMAGRAAGSFGAGSVLSVTSWPGRWAREL